ncbi:MAG TPA: polysaccharide deacetylase family protein, partial [Acidimicrobiales bacterium]|nr:polysaccharide deacetylase family protein [Acidimicrobiales bacterium]
DAELTASVSQTDTTLRDLTGYAPPCMRPPYGAISPRVVDTLARAGKTAVLWSVDPFDWKGPGVAAITSRVLSAVRPGAIVLLHPGSGVRAQTVAALPGIIEGLQARGYRFVSLCGAPPKDERTVIQADSFGTGPGWPGTQLVSNTAIVGAAATATGHGAWVAASDGGVFAFGDAVFAGSLGGRLLNQAVVGMAATPSGRGYWLVAADGGVFAFGDAVFAGSLGGRLLNQVVVGMAATPSGRGYWLVAADGGVFAFGDAVFHGSGAGKVTAGVVSLVVAPDGQGYWLVSSDGAVLARGGAPAVGSLRDLALSRPVVAGAASPTGQGLWLVGGDGGIFALGDAAFTGARPWTTPGTVAVAVLPTAGGYWVVRGTPVAAGGP